MIRLLILAPTLALRAGLRALLAGQEDMEVIGEGANLPAMAEALASADILVSTGEAFSAQELSDLLEEGEPAPGVLLLTDDSEVAHNLNKLPLRAWGLLPLDTSEEELLAAVYALNEGLLVSAPALLQPLLGSSLPGTLDGEIVVEELTRREHEVLQLLAQGLPNKQIAQALQISEHTVKFHVSSIYTKLGVTNRTEAVTLGARLGWVVL